MSEEWRDIPGYEGLYQVSNLGRIKSLERMSATGDRHIRARIMKCKPHRDGYILVTMHRDRKQRTEKVHRLVCSAFHGMRDSTWEPDHLNGRRDDNRESNLEWKTHGANLANQQQATGASGAVGVFAAPDSKSNPWRVYVTRNYKKMYVGNYPTIEKAVEARRIFIAKLDAAA